MGQSTAVDVQLEVCRHCHQPNLVPARIPAGAKVLCWRCGDSLRPWSKSLHNNRLAAVFAAAGLLFCLPAMTLPLMGIKKLGFSNEMGLVEGVMSLFHHGNPILGLLLLFCSVILPIGKNVGLLLLSTRGPQLSAHKQSTLIHVIEWTGRFSVLDLLLVAVLIAAVKVGDLVSVHVGPGLIAFAMVVFLSLLASWAFDPDPIWKVVHDREPEK
jgi:paraquat-inducible protein A